MTPSLTPRQRRAIGQAELFRWIGTARDGLIDYLNELPGHARLTPQASDTTVYAQALGAANVHIETLLEIIGDLTSGDEALS